MNKDYLDQYFDSAYTEAKNNNYFNLNFGVYYTPRF